jgi:hypothetical protein
VVIHVDPEIYHAFKIEAARRGINVDLLGHIALATVFDENHLPRLQALYDKLGAALAAQQARNRPIRDAD